MLNVTEIRRKLQEEYHLHEEQTNALVYLAEELVRYNEERHATPADLEALEERLKKHVWKVGATVAGLAVTVLALPQTLLLWAFTRAL